MPLHSVEDLPGGALLGRWHLLETPAELWPRLAGAAAYAPLLPARAAGLRQAQWLAGRLLVQQMLGTAGSPAVAATSPAPAPLPQVHNDDTGRPYLTGGPLGRGRDYGLALSHAGEWVVALLGQANPFPPGLDIEAVRDKAQRIAPKFLNTDELAAVAALTAPGAAFATEPARLYSLLWSAKETLFKRAGRPGILFRENLLLDVPAGLGPGAGQLPARLRLNDTETRHHICISEPAPGYVLTTCVD